MNLLLDLQILGWLLVGLGVFQALPVGVALLYGEPLLPYAASGAIAVLYGISVAWSVRPTDRRMRVRDGFIVVVGGWLLASGFGALPYALSGELSPVDALFESVSGFTTTGSSVMTTVEGVPRALHLWRALTQWLGGMGIIVFTIAVLPLLGIGGMQLFKAEVSGPVTDKLTPRIAVTARRLWLIYVGFTLAAMAALWIAGMDLFDAVCHAFTTLATGGFSTRNASVGAFAPAVQWVVILFMLVGGISFALHYRLFARHFRDVGRDLELRLYLGILLLATAAVAAATGDAGGGVRHAAFQVVSIVTTTGYATWDYERWPAFARFVIFHLLLVGGMAGSTSGGLKTLRLLLGLSALRTFIWRLTHPHAVRSVRYAGRTVADDVVSGVAVFFLAYLAIATAAATVIAAFGYDIVTSMSAALTAIGNVGPGLGHVGPTEHFGHLPVAAKLVLCFCMLAGRLEIFTVLVILSPHFWRR